MPQFTTFDEYASAFQRIATAIAVRCPGVVTKRAFLHGSSIASVLHLRHRLSWDLDITGADSDFPVDKAATALEKGFGRGLRWEIADHDARCYHGHLEVPGEQPIKLDLLPNPFEERNMEGERRAELGGMMAATFGSYARMKAGSVFDRVETKDFYDLAAALAHPELERQKEVKRAIIAGGMSTASRLRKVLGGDLQRFAAMRTDLPGFRPAGVEQLDALKAFGEQRYLKHKLVAAGRVRQHENSLGWGA